MEYTPREVVKELDRYIVGQDEAKKEVAVALRNRYRRNQLPKEIRDEITPKNIIMKGPTGVGKTEIARRLAKIVNAPFIKVEATKFTEVGYVGRDVDSMIRDLVAESIRLVRAEKYEGIAKKVEKTVDKIILKALYEQKKDMFPGVETSEARERIRNLYKDGYFDEEYIEIELEQLPKQVTGVLASVGMEFDFEELFGGLKKKKPKKVKVEEAIRALKDAESSKLIDDETIQYEALKRAENSGIIFIDEIDKIASKAKSSSSPDVSREGVQRDILPLIEGSTVMTKYGAIKTDYILFIGAGAFHTADIKDLIPELQGRFPVIVELNSLTEEDFVSILSSSENALLKQYQMLLEVDNVKITFSKDAIKQIAKISMAENETKENLGARRLHAVVEKLLKDISYNAGGLTEPVEVKIDKKYVTSHLKDILVDLDFKKYIL